MPLGKLDQRQVLPEQVVQGRPLGPPIQRQPDPLVQAGARATEALWGKRAEIGRWNFSTNGIYWAGKANIPCIGFAPSNEIYAHTVEDQVPIADVVRAWIDAYPYQFKFVVAQPGDIDELEGMLASLRREIPRERVLLMPEGVTPEALRGRAAWLSEVCKARGYRYAHRLHIELYGNQRGT